MSAAEQTIRQTTPTTYPWRMWWGMAGSAAIMLAIIAFGPYNEGFELAPGKPDMFWYTWQLADPSFWSRASAWGLYAVHQISIWYLIANAKASKPRYIFGLHGFNVAALTINVVFIGLHVLQTKYFYDGLAQDVHEATSMMSVILMLWLIMIMENRRRGMIFGKQMNMLNGVGDMLRRYHGYYFSWAIIYTFWYHPFEMTSGHLLGFAYTMLLLLQSSLFFTRYHTNRWWTMSLEVLFVIHGAIVAATLMAEKQGGMWSVFIFGGVMVFLLNQMHGLGLSNRQKWYVAIPLLAATGLFYALMPNHPIEGVTRLPMIMYLGSAFMFVLLWVLMKLVRAGKIVGELSPRDTADAN